MAQAHLTRSMSRLREIFSLSPSEESLLSHDDLRLLERAGAKHPIFATSYARLKTFDTWPVGLNQSPADMAAAGFVYTGQSDAVICFFCAGALRHWVSHEEPFAQHALWHPYCFFLNTMKGEAFVREHTITSQLGLPPTSMEREKPKGKRKRKHRRRWAYGSEEHLAEDQQLMCTRTHESAVEPKDSTAQKDKSDMADRLMCLICTEREREIVYFPCGHILLCKHCSQGLEDCIYCRRTIVAAVTIYIP